MCFFFFFCSKKIDLWRILNYQLSSSSHCKQYCNRCWFKSLQLFCWYFLWFHMIMNSFSKRLLDGCGRGGLWLCTADNAVGVYRQQQQQQHQLMLKHNLAVKNFWSVLFIELYWLFKLGNYYNFLILINIKKQKKKNCGNFTRQFSFLISIKKSINLSN